MVIVRRLLTYLAIHQVRAMYKPVLLLFLILLLGILTVFAFFYTSSRKPLVLVISFDGFRYDYLQRNVTPTLADLVEKGVNAEYMRNVFVTKTFPNHHSIATGLFPSSHGVMSSSVYDEEQGKIISYGEDLWKFGNNVVPIWSLNEKSNQRSGVYMWPGGEFEYQGILPTFLSKYDTSVPWTKRIDTVIEWFTHPVTPTNLVFMYFEEPDSHSHSFSPESDEVVEQIVRCDNITKYLFDQLSQTGLSSELNVFLLSDHGMDSVTTDKIINLTNYVDKSKFVTASTSPALHVIPKQGEFQEVYNELKAASELENFTVYKKEELPDRWHYKNERTPPILLLADQGYAFDDVYDYADDPYNWSGSSSFGIHGYDNEMETMHSLFVGIGPQLKENYKIAPFDSVDLYSLFCEILDLHPPPTNGSLSNIVSVLSIDANIETNSKMRLRFLFTAGGLAMLMAISVLAALLMKQEERSRVRNRGNTLLRYAKGPKNNPKCAGAAYMTLAQQEED